MLCVQWGDLFCWTSTSVLGRSFKSHPPGFLHEGGPSHPLCPPLLRQCCVGTELVDWMLQQTPCVHSRTQAVGMWQVLVEDSVLNHGKMSPSPWKTLSLGKLLLTPKWTKKGIAIPSGACRAGIFI